MKNNKIFKIARLASPEKEVLGFNDSFKKRVKTLETFISGKIKTINGLITRNGGRGLIGILLKYIRGIRPRSSKSVVRQVARFAYFISKMARHSGLKGVVIYLKACQTLLQQSVGGFKVSDLTELKVRPARNRAGVPLIIPAGVRVLISKNRDISSIRLWMTLLGLYRIIEFPGKFSLETITQKGPNLSHFLPEWESFIETHFLPLLREQVGDLPPLPKISMFPILKSGPTVLEPGQASSSELSLIRAARIYCRSATLAQAFIDIANNMGLPDIWQRLRMTSLAHSDILDGPINEYGDGELVYENLPFFTPYPKGQGFLGRLGIKPEPAGKIRVFAMVDAWTQWLLSPLHKWIFKILISIRQDGTFDQLAPIQALQEKYASNPKGKRYASLDLSAATDRLPISLQRIILKVLLKGIVRDSASFSQSWSDLLTKRPYQLTKDILIGTQYNHNKWLSGIYYSVGQPMGALSSWAMLALTHHAMMQYAYYKAYGRHEWYQDYGVLGDDGVLIDGKVIHEYRVLLSKIGVKAGLAKSIIANSKFVIEFAKKFFVDNVQANMLPIKECIATSLSTSLVSEFARKYGMNLNQVLSFMGYGYRAKMKCFNTNLFTLGTRKRVLLVWLSHPSSALAKPSFYEWLTMKSWKENHNPGFDVIRDVSNLCREAVDKKLSRILEAKDRYFESLNNIDKTLDKDFPITIVTSRDRGDYIESENFSYSWKGVLNPDLTSKSDSNFWDESFNVSSSHGYRWKAEQEKLSKLKVGIDFDAIQEAYESFSSVLDDIRWQPDYSEKINMSLQVYFALDDILALIPEEFWDTKRVDEKPFRDFLEIYKLWQDLSRPIWSEFNSKGDYSPQSDANILSDLWKVGNMDFAGRIMASDGPLVTFPDWSNEQKPSPDRGDLEGLRNSSNPPMEVLQERASAWHLLKITFNRLAWLLVLLVDLVVFSLIWIILFEISTPSEISDILLPIQEEISSSPTLPLHLWLGGLGVSILLGVAGYSWYNYGSLWPMIVGVPEILVTDYSVQGPMTLAEYDALQRALENQALLDNLAISPIGDLWISPWN